MDGDNLVQIEGYELANYKKQDPGRTAGGVAIYRSVDSLTQCEPVLPIPEIERLYKVESGVGDMSRERQSAWTEVMRIGIDIRTPKRENRRRKTLVFRIHGPIWNRYSFHHPRTRGGA